MAHAVDGDGDVGDPDRALELLAHGGTLRRRRLERLLAEVDRCGSRLDHDARPRLVLVGKNEFVTPLPSQLDCPREQRGDLARGDAARCSGTSAGRARGSGRSGRRSRATAA